MFRAPRPSAFTFNSPLGACDECNGFGRVLLIDPRKVLPDDTKSIADGAISCWNTETRKKQLRELEKFCAEQEIDTSRPWRKLSEKERQLVFNGAGKKGKYRGINGFFEKLKSKRRHLHVRVFLSRYRSEALCPICEGGRLKREALHYFIEGRSLRDIWFTPVRDLIGFFSPLLDAHRGNEAVEIALEEVDGRLRYLADIGLGYLTLDRQTRTLSGGEHQRVNLTSLLGSRLVNTTIVLDEPTIALHPRDTARLLRSLESLRDRGNSVFVVEHDSEMIAAADEVVDLGPLSGSEGGTIVYQGPVSGLRKSAASLTGKYLSGALRVTRKSIADIAKGDVGDSLKKRIRIEGARANNLRKIDVEIPLECFVVVTGVSGSGKSSLVTDAFFQTYDAYRESIKKGTLELDDDAMVRRLSGLNQVDEVVLVDQSPVGKTPRSNPGTYTKAWEIVRECLADTEDAKRLGLGKSAFSFNVAGGRCPQCEGAGYQRIEMQFLADVFVECEGCGGSRFQDEVLSVRLAGKNVGEILDLTLNEVVEYCGELEDKSRAEKILQRIRPLVDLGLGYLKMGQPLSELSGGEAQRVKLASYVQEGKQRCLFILDEPTTGLHPHNVQALLTVCDRLIEAGHSLLCVEHNMDVIRNADWMIDLGPDGGEDGGQIVLTGNPQQLLADSSAVQRSLTLQECLRADGMERDQHKSVVRPKRKASAVREIRVVGAKEHNLKDVTISIPQDKVTVITGVSGSGKSTLAFDILFQEGQRRYIDCLSPYARQYITQVRRADVERVDHIPPTVAISQKTAPPVGISTIATTTELYQYLRLLYSKAGEQRCPEHGEPITGLGAEELTEEVLRFGSGERLFLYAPAISERKGVYADLFERALRAEITEARIDGVVKTIQPGMRLERQKLHTISLLVGSIQSTGKNRDLVRAAMKQALLLGSGTVEVSRGTKDATPRVFSTERVCPVCRRGFHELDPRDFSFRSLRGMCETCEGRGKLGEEGGIRPVVQCPDCLGARIQELGRNVFIGEKSIDALCAMNAAQLRSFLLGVEFAERMAPVVKPLLKELTHRLEVIDAVGLGYLTLNREASTISGGEAQRLRLARTLGSPLSGICYVFDEPTIGLHPKDHDMLMSIIFRLRDSGNTVVIVEHDEETICQADHVIDVGPFGGRGGGRILADGPLDELLRSEESVTAQALRERIEAEYAPPVAAVAAASSRKAPLRIE
ncbi:MAG: ATP-binding cassette domain-containing protein, partial [Deltaproteobacteria bacterium]|nr:ATP-binding cassette domain-containing protein [Deltaproteobacteria bacterium]